MQEVVQLLCTAKKRSTVVSLVCMRKKRYHLVESVSSYQCVRGWPTPQRNALRRPSWWSWSGQQTTRQDRTSQTPCRRQLDTVTSHHQPESTHAMFTEQPATAFQLTKTLIVRCRRFAYGFRVILLLPGEMPPPLSASTCSPTRQMT